MRITATMEETRQLYGDALVGLVPTLGYLHEGHVALLETARRECELAVMTVFVNPLQFDDVADLDRYPRDLERDVELARGAGIDVVFAPAVEVMYPILPVETVVSVPKLGEGMEGSHRPGHFDGVATVVAKLLAGLQPHRAYFGRKDAQQLAIIRRMVTDLSIPTEIVPHSTVREADGLALSSRNVFLSDDERHHALALSRGLMLAADAAEAGERRGRVLEQLAWREMEDAPGIHPDYVALATARDVEPAPSLVEDSFLAVAARVGSIRLIDNVHFDVAGDRVVADRGILLDEPSVLYSQGSDDDSLPGEE